MGQWIKCSEQMPEYFGSVLLTDGEDYAIGVMQGGREGVFDISPYDRASIL